MFQTHAFPDVQGNTGEFLGLAVDRMCGTSAQVTGLRRGQQKVRAYLGKRKPVAHRRAAMSLAPSLGFIGIRILMPVCQGASRLVAVCSAPVPKPWFRLFSSEKARIYPP
jgi:hypothetical protein